MGVLRKESLLGLARSLTINSFVGFAAGLIAGGVGSRIAMRISAVTAGSAQQGAITQARNVVGQITPGGTIALLILGGLVGTAGGIFYLAMRPWLAGAGRWKGLIFGALLFAIVGPHIIEGRNFDFHTFGPASLNVATFASLFLIFGLLVPPLVTLIERGERSLPSLSFRLPGLISLAARAFGLTFMVGSLAFMVLTIIGFGPGRAVDHLLVAYLVIAVPAASTLLGRSSGGFKQLSDLRGRWRALAIANAVIALPVVVGLVLNAQEIVKILRQAQQ